MRKPDSSAISSPAPRPVLSLQSPSEQVCLLYLPTTSWTHPDLDPFHSRATRKRTCTPGERAWNMSGPIVGGTPPRVVQTTYTTDGMERMTDALRVAGGAALLSLLAAC